jgi:hypothetical protein
MQSRTHTTDSIDFPAVRILDDARTAPTTDPETVHSFVFSEPTTFAGAA